MSTHWAWQLPTQFSDLFWSWSHFPSHHHTVFCSPHRSSCLWKWPVWVKPTRMQQTVCGCFLTPNHAPTASLRYRKTRAVTTCSVQRWGKQCVFTPVQVVLMIIDEVAFGLHNCPKLPLSFWKLLQQSFQMSKCKWSLSCLSLRRGVAELMKTVTTGQKVCDWLLCGCAAWQCLCCYHCSWRAHRKTNPTSVLPSLTALSMPLSCLKRLTKNGNEFVFNGADFPS